MQCVGDNIDKYIAVGRLKIADELYQFIQNEALAEVADSGDFWRGFEALLVEFTPQNDKLLKVRDELQQQLNAFHKQNPRADFDHYKRFLLDIGYLQAPSKVEKISPQNVDEEIAQLAGPQLVVPINNARYAINAVNARWGSLYDALYGSDAINDELGAEKNGTYHPLRGEKVINEGRALLDHIAPLKQGSHQISNGYKVVANTLIVSFINGETSELIHNDILIGYTGSQAKPTSLLLKHHGLHVELLFDEQHPIGKQDYAGIKDIMLEAALTTIMDCEDSVAAVDAQDKTVVYRNWLGLTLGTLEAKISKNGSEITRSMARDKSFVGLDGHPFTLCARSKMFIRNVGHLMKSNAILLDDEAIYEGLMDAVMTSLIAKHDIHNRGRFKNARHGSIYIVKPKMHGADEVAFSTALFGRVERLLGLAPNTIKIGIMDEERRTSLNLQACINAAKERVVFINTGFLDRTGDEIHSAMLAGPFETKAKLKQRKWIVAYERSNVQTGLNSGFANKAQIGKGMWPIKISSTSTSVERISF